MQKIYIINGPAGSGKDTFVELYSEISINTVHNISSVDKVKEAAKILGWNSIKDEIGRKFLSDLKDLSTNSYDGPYNYVMNFINSTKDTVFVHIREPSEIEKIRRKFPSCKTIFINRNTEIKFNNHADRNVENYQYDYYINNDGTIRDLKETIKNFIEENQ